MTRPLRVCLDTRLVDETAGGLKQVAIGLATGLSKLIDGNEEYFFLTYCNDPNWLRPYVHGPASILDSHSSNQTVQLRRRISSHSLVRHMAPLLAPLLRRVEIGLPRPDPAVERASVDILHFTTPAGFETTLPSIYHPHDLQHIHMPQFFDPITRIVRDSRYRLLCDRAQLVAVVSSWVKNDLIKHYGLTSEKIAVVPFAPPLAAYVSPSAEDVVLVREKYGLPDAFVYYPAQTWPHKNHLGLVEALVILRDRFGLIVPMISSGYRNDFLPTIQKRVDELRLGSQVRLIGYVTPLELQCLYRLCRCTVIPSKFEAASFPVWEAFLAGSPVACSQITSLPTQAGDAALLFDPYKPEQIADCIRRLWTDGELRQTLVDRGTLSVSRFTWEKTAKVFRAHYRRIGRRILTDEDHALLAEVPLL